MKYIEIEIQVQVEKIKPLIDFLNKHGDFVGQSRQIDEYFNAPHRDFIKPRPVEEWLRIRTSPKGNSINYKKWRYNDKGKGLFADEYETAIEDVKKMKGILES
ncbi:MAG TPA: CYTH domain-containing protein, partial [Candidatus Saccharimonadales bacterium]|nr:CYTH domain-containing protein [Candidatus Saccharimonadales bacterium]